ncbi:MAG: histidine phosphatase family protein [bacterium]|nr:histidine phosphatase family protein [bacterium]
MSTSILFVRHGETTWNVAKRWQGQADTPLTEQGEAQALRVAALLAAETDRPWTRLVSSDLQRARRTAEAIGSALGLRVEDEPRFRERDVRDWSGLTHPEVEARDPEAYRRFRSGDPTIRMGGGESTLDLRARALAAIRELHAAADGHVIVVTHLGLIRSLFPGAEVANTGRLALDAATLLASPPPTRREDDSAPVL